MLAISTLARASTVAAREVRSVLASRSITAESLRVDQSRVPREGRKVGLIESVVARPRRLSVPICYRPKILTG
jgi:hypothetical protein